MSEQVKRLVVGLSGASGVILGIRMLEVLQEPKRIQQFRIPLKLEDGSFRVFPGYRVHYCDALGPFRDGTRIRPDLTLDEVKHAFHGVDVFERAGHMDAEEAAEWRRRILARQAFLDLSEAAEPAG